ncbi:MAG TPA: DUF488 domain-containing protein [Blastocatellia bacterium]|nr:DUF488 domain-containing protein [Blastocatellia bacterium]
MPTIYTIGFTKKSLREFIGLLRGAGVRTVADIRLRNTSQLAGWSKQPDFAFLLSEGFGIAYEHHPEFAPTAELLDGYKRTRDWPVLETSFRSLLADRAPESDGRALLAKEGACLLCTETTADKCHRRLVAEYLASLAPDLRIVHL